MFKRGIVALAIVVCAAALLLGAETAAKETSEKAPVKIEITSGPDGLTGSLSSAEGSVEVTRRGEELRLEIEGMDQRSALEATRVLMQAFEIAQQGTRRQALESTSDWRNLQQERDRARDRAKSLENSLADQSARISDLQRTVRMLQGELGEVDAQRKKLQGRVEKLEGELRKGQEAKSSTGLTREELRARNFAAVEEARKKRLEELNARRAPKDTQGP